jgi:hypothetical protein
MPELWERSVDGSNGAMATRSIVAEEARSVAARHERRALVRRLSAQVLAVRSPAREHVYAALVSDGENRWWTVRQMAEVMPEDISASTVRTVLYLLLGDAVLELVPRQRNLTLRLSGNGMTVLSELLAQWKAADVESRLPRAAGIGGTR